MLASRSVRKWISLTLSPAAEARECRAHPLFAARPLLASLAQRLSGEPYSPGISIHQELCMERAAFDRSSAAVLAKKPRLTLRNGVSLSRVTAICFDAVTGPFALRPLRRRVAEARGKTPATSACERSGNRSLACRSRLSNPSEGVCLPIGDGELPTLYYGIDIETLISQFASV